MWIGGEPMKYAQVIVDVPTMQTDRPYTYVVPKNFQSVLQLGMRVRVPFGKGSRHVLGFVVGLIDEVDNKVQYKEIEAIEDVEPVLNRELLKLSYYMKEDTFSFQITCLQAMLPAALKMKYERYIYPLETSSKEVLSLFNGKSVLKMDDLDKKSQKQVMQYYYQNKVDIKYISQQKGTIRTRKMIRCILSKDELQKESEELRSNAYRLKELICNLKKLELNRFYGMDTLPFDISNSVLKQAIDRKWIEIKNVESYRQVLEQPILHSEPLLLNEEQSIACRAIVNACQHKDNTTFLLEGVTGSGKTEVYMQSIQQVLLEEKTALVLVPEISLTPQMVERFVARFGQDIAVLHSQLSIGEKYDEWRRIKRGEVKIVVGTRSAIFAPLQNIGLIIIDEEHETSYKQEESPRYHARDIAIWRSKYHHCPLVLGSATPSLETRARAHKGVYQLLRLTKRASHAMLPEVQVVDMTETEKRTATFSECLLQKIQQRLDHKEQIVLMLNQRGYSSFIMCHSCGYVVQCPNCDLSLTLHEHPKRMECHYCGYRSRVPEICPQCHQKDLRYYGVGIQKIEEELKQLFPCARIIRMDADTTRKKGSLVELLHQFETQKADILLGTQMIAKGLDFPNVTLVGVLNADTALNLPDFRSSERTFQLLTQVGGRAGRGDKKGEVIIQSYNPNHYAIQLACHHDYESFFYKEMHQRHCNQYPPYTYMIQFVVSHQKERDSFQMANRISHQMKQICDESTVILGPTPFSISRINKRYYHQIVIKYKKDPKLMTFLRQIMDRLQHLVRRGFTFSIDREPIRFI